MKKVITASLAFILILVFAGCSFGHQSFELSNSELSVVAGETKVITINPESANKKLKWTSSDENIVTVEAGTIKAKSVGSAVITVTAESGFSRSCTVTVTGKAVEKITLDNQTTSINVGKSLQLKATVSPADATSPKLSWSSSDGSVALVNSEGYVTAVSEGVANIICQSDNGVEASCTVTVKGDSKKTDSQSSAQSGYTYIYGHLNPSYTYRASDFVFPESSSRKLSRSEIVDTLSGMVGSPVSNNFAQDAINEIYARNGYVFKDASIRSYYESKAWYYADSGFTINDFSSIESYNIKLLAEYS